MSEEKMVDPALENVDHNITHEPQDEVVEINSVGQLAMLITNWHSQCNLQANHMAEVPAGTQIEFEGAALKLDGDALRAFRAGMFTCMHVFGNMPIVEIAKEPVVQAALAEAEQAKADSAVDDASN